MIALFGRETQAPHGLRVSPWPGYHSFHLKREPDPMPAKAPAAAPSAAESVSPDRLDTREFAKNMLTVGMKSQKLLVDFVARMGNRDNPVPLDPLNISGAMM